jgi:asparagine synthase (glutamine-hydrolysing)
MVSESVRVVLSGVGGDELFAGYPWRHRLALERSSEAEFEDRYYRAWQRLLPADHVADLFGPDLRSEIAQVDVGQIFRDALRRAQGPDRLSRVLAFEIGTFLHALLLVEDKLSMASSIETRAPFTDNAILDLAERAPSRLKFDGSATKILVREALRTLVPNGTLDRPKVGFTPPEASWLRARDAGLLSRASLIAEGGQSHFLDRARVAELTREHHSGTANHRQLLWSIACFQWWSRLFVDRDSHAHALWTTAQPHAAVA